MNPRLSVEVYGTLIRHHLPADPLMQMTITGLRPDDVRLCPPHMCPSGHLTEACCIFRVGHYWLNVTLIIAYSWCLRHLLSCLFTVYNYGQNFLKVCRFLMEGVSEAPAAAVLTLSQSHWTPNTGKEMEDYWASCLSSWGATWSHHIES